MADVYIKLRTDGGKILPVPNPTIDYNGGGEYLHVIGTPALNTATGKVTISGAAQPPGPGYTLVTTGIGDTASWQLGGGGSGTITGPVSSFVGNVPLWDDLTGTALSDSGVAFSTLIIEGDARLTDARNPLAHAASHEDGGSDEINVTGLSGVLADPQTAALHAASHQHGGSDEVGNATSAANRIPKALASGKLDIAWFPLGTSSTTLTVGDDARLSNDRIASGLRTATTVVSTSGAAAPSSGQALIATGPSAATWQSLPAAATNTPATVTTSTGTVGTTTGVYALENHRHQVSAGAVTGLTVGGANVNGTSTSLARSDHVHALPAFGSAAGTFMEGSATPVASGLRSATTSVLTNAAAAPSAGQALIAINSTSAQWATLPSTGDTTGAAASVNDEVVAFSGTGGKTLKQTGILYTDVILAGNAALTNARTPTAHAASHMHGGSDQIASAVAGANLIPKAGASGTLPIGWFPLGTSSNDLCVGDDPRLSNARTPLAHNTTHQSGGSDAISIAGLSGRGASNQTADQIATSGSPVVISSTAPSAGQYLRASGAAAAGWFTPTFGDFSGPASSTSGNLVSFNGTTGKIGQDSGIALANVIQAGDAALTNARTPLAHAASHLHGGSDEIGTTVAAANAIPKAVGTGKLNFSWFPFGTTSTTITVGDDSRLSNDRTASGVRTATTVVATSAATAPTANQSLVATNSTTAGWDFATAKAIATSGTAVAISATAPTSGQVLTATSASAASWQTPSGGGGGWNPLASPITQTASFTAAVNNFYLCQGSSIVVTIPTGATAGSWIWLTQVGWGAEIQLRWVSPVTMSGQAAATRNVYPAGSMYPYGTTSILIYCVSTNNWISIAGHLN